MCCSPRRGYQTKSSTRSFSHIPRTVKKREAQKSRLFSYMEIRACLLTVCDVLLCSVGIEMLITVPHTNAPFMDWCSHQRSASGAAFAANASTGAPAAAMDGRLSKGKSSQGSSAAKDARLSSPSSRTRTSSSHGKRSSSTSLTTNVFVVIRLQASFFVVGAGWRRATPTVPVTKKIPTLSFSSLTAATRKENDDIRKRSKALG